MREYGALFTLRGTGPSTEMLVSGVAMERGIRSTSHACCSNSAAVGRSLGFLLRQATPGTLGNIAIAACRHGITTPTIKASEGVSLSGLCVHMNAATKHQADSSLYISKSHLLKQRRRKSRPSLDRRCGMAGGSLVEAMWNSADTCAVTPSPLPCASSCHAAPVMHATSLYTRHFTGPPYFTSYPSVFHGLPNGISEDHGTWL